MVTSPISKQLAAFLMACEMKSVALARSAARDWLAHYCRGSNSVSVNADWNNFVECAGHHGLSL